MATLGILKMKVLRNKVCDVLICVHDVINQVLWRDLNCIVDAMWPKFGNSIIYMREVITTSIL